MRTVPMSQMAGRWRKLMRKRSNQQNCGSAVECYESVGLSTEQTKVFWQSWTHQTATRTCCTPQCLLLLPYNPRRRVRAGKVWETGENAWETTTWKTMNWMGGITEEITRDRARFEAFCSGVFSFAWRRHWRFFAMHSWELSNWRLPAATVLDTLYPLKMTPLPA